MKLFLTYPDNDRKLRLDRTLMMMMRHSSWINYFDSLTLTLEISGEFMIISLECEDFWCLSLVISYQQIRSSSNQHVADTSSLHLGRFVKCRLSFLIIQHVDNGIRRKCDQKFHHILMSTTCRMMKCRPTHRINGQKWIALEMEFFQLMWRKRREEWMWFTYHKQNSMKRNEILS